jgi:hypothetical protein
VLQEWRRVTIPNSPQPLTRWLADADRELARYEYAAELKPSETLERRDATWCVQKSFKCRMFRCDPNGFQTNGFQTNGFPTAWLALTSRSSRFPSGRCCRPMSPQYRPGFSSITGISSFFAM